MRRRVHRLSAAWVWVPTVVLVLISPARSQEGESAQIRVRPSVRFAALFDDNPSFARAGSTPEFGGWIVPRLELAYRTPALEIGADLRVDVRRTLGEASLGAEFARVSGFAEAGLLPGLRVRTSEAYTTSPRQRGLPPDDVRNLLQVHRSDLGIRYWRELPGGREIELGVQATYFASESFAAVIEATGGGSAVDPNFRADFGQGSATVEYQSPLGHRSSAYVLAQSGYRGYRDSARSGHANASMLLGLRSRWLPAARGELALGYGLMDFGSRGTQHSVLGHATLHAQWVPGWSGFLSVANEFQSNLVGNEVVEATGRIGLKKQFGDRTAATASGFISRFEDEALKLKESLYAGFELEIRHDLTRRSRVELSYRYWRNPGNSIVADFDQNRIVLQYSFRL